MSNFNDRGYKETLKIPLKQLIHKKLFRISELIPVNRYIYQIEWLDEIDNTISRRGVTYVVGMFNSICMTCLSGYIIRRILKIPANGTNLEVVIILSREYSQTDVENFKSQFNIGYRVYRVDDKLNKKWEDLGSEFIESWVNNIVFIVDSSRKIVRVAHPGCDCYDEVLDYSIVHGKKGQ